MIQFHDYGLLIVNFGVNYQWYLEFWFQIHSIYKFSVAHMFKTDD